MFSKVKEHGQPVFLLEILVTIILLKNVEFAESRVIISSNLTNGDAAYDGQMITFTCVSRGPIITWRSDDYIGMGGQELRQSFVDLVGQTERSSTIRDTFARLISVTNDNEGPVITSELHIRASLANNRSSITCTNNSVNGMKTIAFNVVSSMVALTSNLSSNNTAYDGQMIVFRCISRGTLHVWISSEYIGTGGQDLRLSFVDSIGQTANSPVFSETVARLVSVRNRNSGAPLMESELQILARRMQWCSVSCSNNGIGELNTTFFGVIDMPEIPITDVTHADAEDMITRDGDDDSRTAAAMTVGEDQYAEGSTMRSNLTVAVSAAVAFMILATVVTTLLMFLYMLGKGSFIRVQHSEKGFESSPPEMPEPDCSDTAIPKTMITDEQTDSIQDFGKVTLQKTMMGHDRTGERKESSSSDDSSDKSDQASLMKTDTKT